MRRHHPPKIESLCSPTNEWMKSTDKNARQFYSVGKWLLLGGKWVDLEIITLSEINQTREDKYLFSITCGLLSETGMKVEHESGRAYYVEKRRGRQKIIGKKCKIFHVFSHLENIHLNIHLYV